MQTVRSIIHNASRTPPIKLGKPFNYSRATFLGRFLWAFAV